MPGSMKAVRNLPMLNPRARSATAATLRRRFVIFTWVLSVKRCSGQPGKNMKCWKHTAWQKVIPIAGSKWEKLARERNKIFQPHPAPLRRSYHGGIRGRSISCDVGAFEAARGMEEARHIPKNESSGIGEKLCSAAS